MEKIYKLTKKRYPRLFSTLKIGQIELKNRIFFPPWALNWAYPDGTLSPELSRFYIRLAEGGCGTVYTGFTYVSDNNLAYPGVMRLHNRAQLESNRLLCRALAERECIPAIQLAHFGRQLSINNITQPLLAPSNIPCRGLAAKNPHYRIKEMSEADIQAVQADFIHSAELAAEAGYKIIQLHAAHGYLLSNFLSPYTNKRTDGYGGSPAGRLRMLVEIIHGIRRRVGSSVALDIRLSVDEFVPAGLIPKDYKELIPLLEDEDIDLVNASATIQESAERIFREQGKPEARFSYLARKIKEYSHRHLPVGYAGIISSLETGEQLLAAGDMDLVGFGRKQFADPAFVNKSLRGDKINHCIWCGKCITDVDNPALQRVYCTVNPDYKRPPIEVSNEMYRQD